MNVLFDPNPFCFGSTSTMRAVIDELPEATTRVLAIGPVQDLCDGLWAEPHDVRDAEALQARPDLLRWADVYVAISNNTNVDVVARAGVPIVFVDVLFWMKRQHTRAMDVASSYIIENYPGVDDKLSKLPMLGAIRVGPIVRHVKSAPDGHTPLLVNIGGAASPHLKPGTNTDYPDRVATLADGVARRRCWGPVEVAMGSAAAASVAPRPLASPATLSNRTYLERLQHADVLLTSPGLNAPLEAFAAGVPVAFLPPQNLTQVFHLRAYVDAGLAAPGLGLHELLPEFDVASSTPEKRGTADVLRALAQLDDQVWSHVRGRIEDRLDHLNAHGAEHVRRQRSWLASLGPNGARATAEQIRRCAP